MARHSRKTRHKPRQLSRGTISVLPRGFAFVDTPEGEFFIHKRYLRGAMDGDLVEVAHLQSLEHKESQQRQGSRFSQRAAEHDQRKMLGSVQRVLERAHETIIGTLHYAEGLGIVVPHNQRIIYDIFIDSRVATAKIAQEGDVVVVRMTGYPGRLESAQGYVQEILGREDDQGMDIQMIIRDHGLETAFSAAALEQAQQAQLTQQASTLSPDDAPQANPQANPDASLDNLIRRDLRGRYIFTIDPTDAKDFDDALSVDFINGHLRLGVHIADVSSYVPWDSALDLNARRRSTSVYLPGQVIPMLPEQLSNGLCSLSPGADKAAFTVDMLIDTNGAVLATQFFPSLIRSSQRLTYDQVTQLFQAHDQSRGKVDTASTPDLLTNKLLALRKLSKKLLRRRLQRGALEFQGTEAKITLDHDGRPIQVDIRTKSPATSLVEEAMILANEQVAAYMLNQNAPMIYRIHEEPLPSSLEEALPLLQEFGYAKGGVPQTSRQIQAILEASSSKPEHYLISTLLLRAMKRARYTPVFTTHFGLASSSYTHFTSPIRRYPDLMVHRLLKYQLAQVPLPDNMARGLEGICNHASDQERQAEEATMEATALKLCEWLLPRTGETFDTLIVAVNARGITVREELTTAEGLVNKDSLPQGYEFDFKRQRYYNPNTNRSYRLGQYLKVRLIGAGPTPTKLDFVIA